MCVCVCLTDILFTTEIVRRRLQVLYPTSNIVISMRFVSISAAGGLRVTLCRTGMELSSKPLVSLTGLIVVRRIGTMLLENFHLMYRVPITPVL